MNKANPPFLHPKPGSSWYYCLLHTLPKHQTDLLCLYTFFQTLYKTSFQEITVAKAKLSWWANEIQQIPEGRISHPLSEQLKIILNLHQFNIQIFLDAIHAFSKSIEPFYFDTQDDLFIHCRQTTPIEILVQIQDKEAESDFSKNAAIFLGMVTIIRNMGLNLKAQKLTIPHILLTQFNITPEAIFDRTVEKKQWILLMSDLAQKARQHYSLALQSINNPQRMKQKNVCILLKLYCTLLDEIQKSEFDLWQKSYYLTPIRKWWIAQTYRFGV